MRTCAAGNVDVQQTGIFSTYGHGYRKRFDDEKKEREVGDRSNLNLKLRC